MKDGQINDGKLELEFIARIKNTDGIIVDRTVSLKDALPDINDFTSELWEV